MVDLLRTAAVRVEWDERLSISAQICSWIWQNLKKDVLKVEGTPCVAESGATGN